MSFATRIAPVVTAAAKYPPPAGVTLGYGTAGFRNKAEVLSCAVFRSAVLAALRSQYHKGQAIGVMITASHNPVQDNGMKICDPLGDMLESKWEKYAAAIANAGDGELQALFENVVTENNIDTSITPLVYHAMDTRPSGPSLTAALVAGLESYGAEHKDYGLLSTPQLHHMVRSVNSKENLHTEDGYFTKLAEAYREVVGTASLGSPVVIDSANGVGAAKAVALNKALGDALEIIVVKSGEGAGEVLNEGCGADFVKVGQRAPEGLEMKAGARHGSLDGDADRLVYYFKDDSGKFHLLDGDKIAALFTAFIQEKLKTVGITDISVGCVQTAYANGSSTKYMQDKLGVEVAFTPTGVKHLHHRAIDFDVGVYFEANGHGTVVFGSKYEPRLTQVDGASLSADQKTALVQLKALPRLINQAVGDALSDALFVEAILAVRGWDISQWSALYTELPNRLDKVTVTDRTAFQTTDADRVLVKPDGCQAKIEALVATVSQGRSFVRPSGTEDVVRVYAEAATQKEADELNFKVATLVFDEFGGVGNRPAQH